MVWPHAELLWDRPELAVVALSAVPHAVAPVVRVPVADVEAEAFPPLLRHQQLAVVVGNAVFLLQAAQRQDSVDGLEDDGADHLGGTQRPLFIKPGTCTRAFISLDVSAREAQISRRRRHHGQIRKKCKNNHKTNLKLVVTHRQPRTPFNKTNRIE